jgi:hypothetical protein
MGQTSITKTRRDGWTAERQLRFLDALAHRRSITRAAAAVGMSRESAYRLRSRTPLFAALWDRALNGTPLSRTKGHEVERVQLPIAPKTGEGHEVEEVEGPLFPPAPPATP